MGGSGGGRYFNGKLENTLDQLKRANTGIESESYEAETNHYLADLVSEFNDRPVDRINDCLDEIAEVVRDGIHGTIALRFGGSVAKHTYVDGLSDVDALVVIDDGALVEEGPDAAKRYLASRLKSALGEETVRTGDLAVTVDYGDLEIQLVPAIRVGEETRIGAANGKEWARIDPKGFAAKLTAVNQQQGSKVVPAIKLAKAAMSNLPAQQRMTGYHAEAVAVEVFKEYDGPRSPKALLQYFFSAAAERVLQPISDSTGQSIHVDDYLGARDSLERQVVASGLARLARRLKLADSSHRVADWREVFGES